MWCPKVKCLHYRGVCLWSGGCLHLLRGCLPYTPCADQGRHPPGRHSPGQAPLWVDTLLARHPLADPPRQTTPPLPDTTGYGQQAGGTHPTGMYSCYWFYPLCKSFFYQWYPLSRTNAQPFSGGGGLDPLLITLLLDFKISIYFKYIDSEQAALIDCTLTHFQLG